MGPTELNTDAKVAVLVDCENASPDVLEYALQVAAQFGRVVLRRGFGNQNALANKWQEALVRRAFTPCLQYTYASGKNTSDIALAMDAIEAMFDGRADTFCLVTSDSDFAGLCRKLRERGATVHIVGEAKTPEALRNASDQFFEWAPAEPAATAESTAQPAKPAAPPKPKQRPKSVVNAVRLMAAETTDGRVALSALGSYLRRMDPGFTPQAMGHSGLASMLKTYDLLSVRQEAGGHWTVALATPKDAPAPAAAAAAT